MSVPRILIDSSVLKVSKTGIDVTTAADPDLVLSITARNAQLIASGIYAMSNLTFNFTSNTWSGTIDLVYPDYGGVPNIILAPITYRDNYDSKGSSDSNIIGTELFYFDESGYSARNCPSTMPTSVYSNTEMKINCTGPLNYQYYSTGTLVYRQYVGAWAYFLVRKPIGA